MTRGVWLIDDCPLATRLTRARLLPLGVNVTTFPSGQAAVAAWISGQHEPPLAVLMDLNMPGYSGLDAGQLLRNAGYLGLLILHSGSPLEDQASLNSHGFDGVLVKPVTTDTLREMLEHAERKQLRRTA